MELNPTDTGSRKVARQAPIISVGIARQKITTKT